MATDAKEDFNIVSTQLIKDGTMTQIPNITNSLAVTFQIRFMLLVHSALQRHTLKNGADNFVQRISIGINMELEAESSPMVACKF